MSLHNIRISSKFKCLAKPFRYYVFHGGRGSSKSHSIARFLICEALRKRTKILCTRELQNSIQESVYTLLKELILKYELTQYFEIKINSIDCVNGSQFIFKGLAHNIESVKSTEGVDIVWIEEADKVSQNSWDILFPTIRKEESRVIISFNPTHDDDPVYQMFIKETMPDSIVVEVNWYDNKWFPEVLKKEKDHMRATNYDKYLHVWEGQLRTISDAQVFKNKFVVEPFSSAGVDRFYHGMDFGFSVDPTAIVRMFIRGRNLYIDREQYGHHVEINHIPAMIRAIFEGSESYRWQIKADAARPETISYLSNKDFNIKAAKKWAGSVEDGIEFLKSFDKIIIHPSCKHTESEFRRYSYKVDKHTNEILPIVVDDYNHCIAEGELVYTSKGRVPIENIKAGDFVRTRSGYRPVTFAGPTGINRSTVVIMTEGGKKLICTPCHKIWTQKGFVRADALRYGDELFTIKEKSNSLWKKALFGTKRLISLTQRKTDRINTIDSIFREKKSGIFTEIFGKKKTAKYQKDITCIILTETLKTIVYQILNFSLSKTTVKNTQLKTCKSSLSISKIFDISRKNGTSQKKGESFIEKLELLVMLILFQSLKSVSVVTMILWRKLLVIKTYFVLISANQNGDETMDSTTSQRTAHVVKQSLRHQNSNQATVVLDRVRCVLDSKTKASLVYDLTVKVDHEFFAGDILVHNCIDAIRYGVDDLIKSHATIYDDGVL